MQQMNTVLSSVSFLKSMLTSEGKNCSKYKKGQEWRSTTCVNLTPMTLPLITAAHQKIEAMT